jgi:hypothetical protein
MDFFTNNDFSNDKTCHDIKYRYNLYDKVILYEEQSKGTKYNEFELSEDDIRKNGGIGGLTLDGLFNSIKGFFKGLYNKIRRVPQRVFVSTHQFFGCSHLMGGYQFYSKIFFHEIISFCISYAPFFLLN